MIDNFGKYRFGVPTKIRAAQTITNDFANIIAKCLRKPSLIGTDDGKWLLKVFYRVLKQYWY